MVKKIPRVKEGFTLIELSLSLIFIGIISLSIVLIITNTIASYRRGLMLDQINTVGMDLVDDFRYAVQNSTIKLVTTECAIHYEPGKDRTSCEENGALGFVNYTKTGTVGSVSEGEVPIYGAFCTGSYSYIWTSGYVFSDSTYQGKTVAEVSYGGSGSGARNFENPRLLKVRDDARNICYSAAKSEGKFKMDETLPEEPVDLLSGENDNRLALYSLEVAPPAESATNGSVFYSASFILGTVDSGVNIRAKGNSCKVPTDAEQNFDYCAINKFNFAIQAGGA